MTIEEIYATINPLPAKLSEKGKVCPEVVVMINANAGLSIYMDWKKRYVFAFRFGEPIEIL